MGPESESGLLRLPSGGAVYAPVSIRIALVGAPAAFVDTLLCLPFQVTYQVFDGDPRSLSERVIEFDPSAVFVCSGPGILVSAYQVAKDIRGRCRHNSPVVLLHHGEYDDLDLEEVSDLEARFPTTFGEKFNLLVCVLRLVHNVHAPTMALVQNRRLSWRLALGVLSSLMAGAILLALTVDLETAIQGAAATCSAITGTELVALFRKVLTRP